MAPSVHSITFDCANPRRLAGFWAAAIGYDIKRMEDDLASVVDPAGNSPRLLFLRVPEEKTVKNRVHLDLRAAGRMEDEVERMIGLGARRLTVFDEPDDMFTVMQDPEGNEFCVEAGPEG